VTTIDVRTDAFADQDVIPQRYTRDGADVSPPLHWSGVPDGTGELLLICHDPDAPSGDFLHWLVTGIDPDCAGCDEGSVPRGGKEWPNGFGEAGYVGPAPPVGDPPHHYLFQLYALTDNLPLPDNPSTADVLTQLDGQPLASGTLPGRYQRWPNTAGSQHRDQAPDQASDQAPDRAPEE
jgi:Raf kinase inhibitor-like YbhB/YbcL family protein